MSERKPFNEMSDWELRIETGHWLGWLFVRENEDPTDGHLFLVGSPPGDIHVTWTLPNWPQDLNTAIKDCTPAFRLPVQIYFSKHFQQWVIDIPGFLRQVKYAQDIPGIARAITEAFCAMKRQEVGNG